MKTKRDEVGDRLYGEPKTKTGLCFKCLDIDEGIMHYYKQFDRYVLHINPDLLCINTLHVAYLNDKCSGEAVSVSTEVFDEVVRNAILDLELYKFLT